MIYLPAEHVIFAALQKTGSLSVRQWLLKKYRGIRVLDPLYREKYHRWTLPKPLEDPRPFVFTVVRHPIKRMESLWNYRAVRRGEDETFESLVEHYAELGYGQAEVCDRYIKPDQVLNLEQLTIQIPTLPFYREDRPMPGHLRRTPRVKPELTNAQCQLVRDVWPEDFERFGYD